MNFSQDFHQVKIHFIAGLPRSGSTLLAAILRQNPRFHAAVTSPLHPMCMAMLRQIGAAGEHAAFFSDDRRRRILTGLFDAYYAADQDHVIFDTARLWSSKLPLIAALFPRARTICCVRDIRWILDSAERMHRKTPLQTSALFEHDPATSMHLRVNSLMEPTKGLVGAAWTALREGWFSDQADKLIVLRYETLVATPMEAMTRLYQSVGEPSFDHDFGALSYAEPDYDARLGMPGLHDISGPIHAEPRQTVLAPDLFDRYGNLQFWLNPAGNPRQVEVI
jgi:sulfotransferase